MRLSHSGHIPAPPGQAVHDCGAAGVCCCKADWLRASSLAAKVSHISGTVAPGFERHSQSQHMPPPPPARSPAKVLFLIRVTIVSDPGMADGELHSHSGSQMECDELVMGDVRLVEDLLLTNASTVNLFTWQLPEPLLLPTTHSQAKACSDAVVFLHDSKDDSELSVLVMETMLCAWCSHSVATS